MDFNGSIPALVTPFENGELHRDTLHKLIDWHVEQGSSGLVICGTTGESPTLGHEEQIGIIRQAVEIAAKRIYIIAGTGSNCTKEALYLTKAAQDVGADGILHATGYYNKPSQAQVIAHFGALNQATNLPIIVYNIPSRTGQELTVETMTTLAQMENIKGVKDSTGDVVRLTMERLAIKKPFSWLSGDDGSSLGYIAHGGHGSISVTANVAPRLVADMLAAARNGDFVTARALQDRLMPLHLALFLEPSPGGIKYAMSKLGLCANEMRLPISPVTPVAQRAIDQAMEIIGL